MAYPISIKLEAQLLRKRGYSIKEIAKIFNLSVSTSSLWLNDIKVSEAGKKRLKDRSIFGQYKGRQIMKDKYTKKLKEHEENARVLVSQQPLDKNTCKTLCALIFWCEGSKNIRNVRFTNSDPKLIQVFLSLFRRGFDLNEKKFRALVHLHDYHKDSVQKKYWSKITKIPKKQFLKSYNKPHTGLRKHDNYQGCLALYYYDAAIAKELFAIYEAFKVKLCK